MKPVISIVVVVKNERSIADTLAGIERQQKPAGTEVVVVDASDVSTLDDIATQHPAVRWIRYRHPRHKKFTIPEQRNVGIQEAKGTIIVFIDAGCSAADWWLQRLTSPILNDGEKICAGTVVATDPRIFNSFKRDPHVAEYLDEAPAGNLALHRDVIQKVGLFDESLTYGEDVDYTWRAHDAGFAIRLVPDAVIAHDFGTLGRRLKRTVRYGAARVPLYAKHRQRLTKVALHEPATVIYPIFLLGLPVMVVWPYYPILLGLLLLKNIGRNPLGTVSNNLVFGLGVLRGLATLALQPQRQRKPH